MKHQYFGDINDYRKYGLIRALTGFGKLTSAICWMLTEDDGKPDGGKAAYLEDPEKWRGYDPDLFDHLKKTVLDQSIREIRIAREMDLIPGASHYGSYVEDDIVKRIAYFTQFIKESEGKDLIFFDPDNGMEVVSVPEGRKNSSKYLFWRELRDIHKAGASILIYQHFPREVRDAFITRMVNKFREVEGFESIITFQTANIVFFLLLLVKHLDHISEGIKGLKSEWGNQFEIKNHKRQAQKDPEEVLLERVNVAGRDYEGALWNLTRFYSENGEQEKAFRWVERLMSLTEDPGKQAFYYMTLGQIMEKVSDFPSAIDFYHQVLALNPQEDGTRYFALNNTGYCLNMLGEHEEAEVFCNEAIAIFSMQHNAYKNLGVAVAGQGRYAEAAEAFMTATQVQPPRDPRSLRHLEYLHREHPEIADEVSRFEERL